MKTRFIFISRAKSLHVRITVETLDVHKMFMTSGSASLYTNPIRLYEKSFMTRQQLPENDYKTTN